MRPSSLPEDAAERDDGLAEERTDLAWSRSGLALLAAFAILARRIWTAGATDGDFAAVALLASASILWAIAIIGTTGVRHHSILGPRSAAQLQGIAMGTVAVAAAGLVISLLP